MSFAILGPIFKYPAELGGFLKSFLGPVVHMRQVGFQLMKFLQLSSGSMFSPDRTGQGSWKTPTTIEKIIESLVGGRSGGRAKDF